jgi:hypothetical protein
VRGARIGESLAETARVAGEYAFRHPRPTTGERRTSSMTRRHTYRLTLPAGRIRPSLLKCSMVE